MTYLAREGSLKKGGWFAVKYFQMRLMVDRGQFCMMGLNVIRWLDCKWQDHWVSQNGTAKNDLVFTTIKLESRLRWCVYSK